jgi:protein TonB
MNRRIVSFSCLFCALAIHGWLLLIVSVKTANRAELIKAADSAAIFSLINIAVREPAVFEAPRPAPRVPPRDMRDMPEQQVMSPETAEFFMPVDIIEENAAVQTPDISAGHSVTEAAPEAGAAGRTGTANYVQRNFNYIQRRIQNKLKYPPEAKRSGIRGSTDVIFTIRRDGTVSDVSIQGTSGQELLDAAALEAVHAAAPFSAPPAEARIAITIVFSLR